MGRREALREAQFWLMRGRDESGEGQRRPPASAEASRASKEFFCSPMCFIPVEAQSPKGGN
jgi:hypothetical protein